MMSEQLESATASLSRIQDFSPSTLSRQGELGTKFAFDEVIESAQVLVDLFKQLPIEQITQLPDQQLKALQQQADAAFKTFSDIQSFDPAAENPTDRRTQLIDAVIAAYTHHFNSLFPLIAYLSSRTTDFTALQHEGRAVIQSVRDEAARLGEDMEKHETEAMNVLAAVRRAAAEQGVAQQAIYFQQESDGHQEKADNWRKWTIWTAAGLGAFAILSTFAHKWEFLTPISYPEAIQLTVSKVLIFGVIAYMLVLCARNFLAHTHNAIINKHRQNALMTFKALVDAAQIDEKQDIVLTHAAESIFAPQDTGYTKHSPNVPSSTSQTIVRSLPRLVGKSADDAGSA